MTPKVAATGRLLRAGMLHHLFGIGGQLVAALPVIFVAMILSHTVGLPTAGEFVIAAGVSAVVFTVAYLGLIYYVSVDRLREFDTRDYALTRLGATVVAALVVLVVVDAMGIPLALGLFVAMLRASDAAIELALGIDLLRRPSEVAMRRYALINAVKLAIILVSFVPALLVVAEPVRPLIVGAAIAAVVCWSWLLGVAWGQRATLSSRRGQLSRSVRLARRAVWFTLAASVSAAAVSMPRLLMPSFYDGDLLGVVGVSLTFGTGYSVALLSSWLRWFPRLSKAPASERRYSGFILESSAMALLFLLLNMTIAPWIVSVLFGFDLRVYLELCGQVLTAWVLAAFAMNMANLFKLTRAVWLESLAYAASVFGGLALALAVPAVGVPGYLAAAATLMLLVVVIGMARADFRHALDPADHGLKRGVFLRTATRPVPRVVRMMNAAKEVGIDPIFVGAFREPDAPAHDAWEGFPVRRVGRQFPLLNRRRPWLYVRSVMSCNVGFWTVLRAERPGVIHASDFETTPAAILYRLSHRCRLVYNIHDNLALRYELPAAVRCILNLVEGVAVLMADQTLVPETIRRDALPRWCRRRVAVVRNIPADVEHAQAPPFESGRIRLFYGGWLDPRRGLDALLLLAREPDIDLRIAGEGTAEVVAALRANPTVTYLGFLSPSGILEETRRCHFVPALYDPGKAIYRLAAPNKVTEALAIGRPIILNQELEIAKDFVGVDCVIQVRYAEAGAVAPRLRALVNEPGKYADACAHARQIFEARYDWEKAEGDSRRALTGEATVAVSSGGNDPAGPSLCRP